MLLLRSVLTNNTICPKIFSRLLIPSIRISRPYSSIQSRLIATDVVPCDLLKTSESNFCYDIKASTIFQYDDGPASQQYAVRAIAEDTPDTTWLNAANCTNNELIERLIYISNLCATDPSAIERTDFDTFIDTFTARLSEFSENEFMAALQVFFRIPTKYCYTMDVRNYVELWMAFDDISGHWAQKWTIEKLLNACSVWVTSHLRRKSKFCHVASKKLLKRAKHLPAKQYLQAMSFVKTLGKSVEDKAAFIKDLDRILDDVSVEELSNLCRLIKSNSPSRLSKPDLISRIIAKIVQDPNLDAVDDAAFYYLTCVIHLSIRLEHKDALMQLMHRFCSQIPHRSPRTALAFCVIAERIHLFHEESIRALVKKALNNIAEFKLSDIEQTCLALAKFGIQPEFKEAHELCQLFLEEIPRRTEEIVLSPKRFIPLLYCLATLGYYNEELIHNALRKEFVDAVYPHYSMFPPEIYGLDAFVSVNLRDTYKGNRLDGKNVKGVIKHVMAYIPDENGPYKVRYSDRMLLDVAKIVADRYKYYCLGHALPQIGFADIYMIFDKNEKKFIDYREHFPQPYSGLIMWKDELTQNRSNLEVLVLVSSLYKDYYGDSTTPNTFHMHKLKQLELLGYKFVDVCHNEWSTLDTDGRRNYIEYKINNVLSDWHNEN